jgi:hypothetical protein
MSVRRVLFGKRALLSVFLVLASIAPTFQPQDAQAAQISNRKLTLVAGATDGGSKAGGVVNHLYTFTTGSTASIGSILFQYCTAASGLTCTTPTGLVTTSATIGSQSGATGFTATTTTAGAPYLTRAVASIPAGTVLSYQLNTITNPTTVNQAFYVRITTFTSVNVTTGAADIGTVAASTSTQIILTGTMPESLTFCTGGTITAVAGVPDCSTATSGSISFNQFFSPSDTATASSQMAASTNANTGYVITVNGPTLTSGSNTIPAMAAAGASAKGTAQFGMNLKANTATTSLPTIGSDISTASNGVERKAQSLTGYDTVDSFKFTSGDTIANSAVGGAGPTNSQIYTSSYIVNVEARQIAGTYTTTLTYICTATF